MIWFHLLKKSWIEEFSFFAVFRNSDLGQADKSASSIRFIMEILYCLTLFGHFSSVEIAFFESLPLSIFYIWSDLFLDCNSYINWMELVVRVWVSFQSMGLRWIMLPIINSWSMLCHHLVLVRSVCENEILLIYIIQQKENSILPRMTSKTDLLVFRTPCNHKVRARNLSDLLEEDRFIHLPRFR